IHCISSILPLVPPLLLTPTISSSLTPAITSLFPDELRIIQGGPVKMGLEKSFSIALK
ncbi:hypothetical protein ISN45_Aa06g012330, partial [Arabidopsis thaliana x Arabidopsis arenosa]